MGTTPVVAQSRAHCCSGRSKRNSLQLLEVIAFVQVCDKSPKLAAFFPEEVSLLQ